MTRYCLQCFDYLCLFFRNKDEITNEVLNGVNVFILAAPKEKFTESEFNVIKKYLDNGGSILVMMAEGGEKTYPTNINFLLEEFGIMVNSGKYYKVDLSFTVRSKNRFKLLLSWAEIISTLIP